jgi:hypothetical protein
LVDALGSESGALELDSDRLRREVRGHCQDTLYCAKPVLDSATGVLAGNGANRPDPMPIPLTNLRAGGPCQFLDTVEGDDVRVVVEAEDRGRAVFHDVRFCHSASLSQQFLQPLNTGVARIGDVRQEDGKVDSNSVHVDTLEASPRSLFDYRDSVHAEVR